MEKPFKGMKVVELASVLAGPSVGMFFAELGAEVLKVENPKQNGDVSRSWRLATEDKSHPFSAYYSSVNWGKKSVFWDLKNTDDIIKLHAALSEATIVIANFKSGDAEKLKLDYESIKKIQPNIIYGEISGFGKSKRIAYDVVLQAECGFLFMNGEPNRQKVKMPVALIDLLTAHQLKEGLLLALIQQQKKKQAIKVSVSLFDAALASLANQATNWLMASYIPQAMGSLHPNIAPYGECFTTSDQKQIVLAVGNDNQFKRLCELLDLSKIVTDKRFENNQNRVQNRAVLAQLLDNKIKQWSRKKLLKQLIDQNVPAGAIRNMEEVFDQKEAQKQIISEEKEGRFLKTVRGNVFQLTYG